MARSSETKNVSATTGYSGAPLPKKLGIKPGMKYLAINAPPEFNEWLGALPEHAQVVTQTSPPFAAVHVFVTEKQALTRLLRNYRHELEPAGFIWVSWPKKAAKVTTDITEDVIRAVALPLDFVDIKVCAVSAVWSGLKLVIRKEKRGIAQP
ncbi:MAG: DUF3052 domain-containing protein [Gammaproteobacteria bacterium]|nr:DUF3052 domain-containing protein [Gammaproteobacteria bacterium]